MLVTHGNSRVNVCIVHLLSNGGLEHLKCVGINDAGF